MKTISWLRMFLLWEISCGFCVAQSKVVPRSGSSNCITSATVPGALAFSDRQKAKQSKIPECDYTNSLTGIPYPLTLDIQHRLAPGDRLSFRIEEELDEPKSLLVADSGEIEIPYLGRFPAQGKTCRELALQLKESLERDYYFRATVIVSLDGLTKSRGRVYVVGPVRSPGPQEIPGDESFTVSKAVMRAGGFTEFADRRRVKVARMADAADSHAQTYLVDMSLVLEKGKLSLDMPLVPGDLVIVSERTVRF